MPFRSIHGLPFGVAECTCALPECTNSKSKGASMRLCAQCKLAYYCSSDCQRNDWKRHKLLCKKQAARLAEDAKMSGQVAVDFEAWHMAVNTTLFTWICCYGLAIYRHPENVSSQYVLLFLRQRQPRPSNVRRLFLYENIQAVDRSETCSRLGIDQEMIEYFRNKNEQAKKTGHIGAATLVVLILPPSGVSVVAVRYIPVIIAQEVMEVGDSVGWKTVIKDIINEGRNVKRELAEKEKTDEFERGSLS
ncbi:hypothetical protein K438DRAFT_1972124 [Mycena galopus ATCC 62051]|nr:hypothetical protein K438DRAFT_1972124 [Mycena galopus ATCC 62051]